MPLVFTNGDPDPQGRLPVVLIHNQPKQLSAERRKQGVDVDSDQLVTPVMEPGQKAKPWLTVKGDIEWEITDPPDDDPQVMASRLADTEARLEAFLTVVASKDVVSRQEVDQEQARDKPSRR